MIKNKSILSSIYMIQDYRNGSHFLEETVDSVLNELKLLDKELEALQQHRSCENCISWETGRKTISTCILGVCDGTCFSTKGDFMFKIQVANGTHKDFCCNRYEAKGAMRCQKH